MLAERRRGKKLKRSVVAALFAVSGLICWCGISQVISNSVSSAFENAFHIPPLTTTLVLTAIAAVIVLRKNATVKSLDVMVPIMAVCYFVITVGIVLFNLPKLPAVFGRIFAEAFGLRQAVAGGFGAVLMNGVKRGLFSNEAGSGSAPCAAAAAECDDPVKMGFVQALGVLIDTVVICSCTAFLMLLVPQEITEGLAGMDLLQTALQYHLGGFGVVFIAVTLALFSFSTFLGVLYYARGNVAYLCGDNWWSQTVYKLIALVMLVIGGMQAYTVVWDLGDVGIGLMTIFNMIALVPMAKEALAALNDYENAKTAVNSKGPAPCNMGTGPFRLFYCRSDLFKSSPAAKSHSCRQHPAKAHAAQRQSVGGGRYCPQRQRSGDALQGGQAHAQRIHRPVLFKARHKGKQDQHDGCGINGVQHWSGQPDDGSKAEVRYQHTGHSKKKRQGQGRGCGAEADENTAPRRR